MTAYLRDKMLGFGRSLRETTSMKLECESGVAIDSPTLPDLSRIDGEEFAILSRDSDTYIQCAEQDEPPWEYVLEYQEGSIQDHFRAVDGPISLQQVVAAFSKYVNGDESWKHDFQWERMDLS